MTKKPRHRTTLKRRYPVAANLFVGSITGREYGVINVEDERNRWAVQGPGATPKPRGCVTAVKHLQISWASSAHYNLNAESSGSQV